MEIQFGAPMITKASYPDGVSRGDKWELSKESAKREQEAARAKKHKKFDEANRLTKEAKTLAWKASKKRDKDSK
jgi:hypothetical protein